MPLICTKFIVDVNLEHRYYIKQLGVNIFGRLLFGYMYWSFELNLYIHSSYEIID